MLPEMTNAEDQRKLSEEAMDKVISPSLEVWNGIINEIAKAGKRDVEIPVNECVNTDVPCSDGAEYWDAVIDYYSELGYGISVDNATDKLDINW